MVEDLVIRNVTDRLKVVKHPLSTQSSCPNFRDSVLEGLVEKPAGQRTMEFRFFYDDEGSELFEQITTTPEYYLTRCETQLLSTRSKEVAQYMREIQKEADQFNGRDSSEGSMLIELGSGSSTKTPLIIKELINSQKQLTYVPIDISGQILEQSSLRILESFPEMSIDASHGLYEQGIQYASKTYAGRSKLISFLGSSIGNFSKAEEITFLKLILSSISKFDSLLIGFDLKKDSKVLEAAYDDSAQITAHFNLNLLRRVNRELGGNFDLSKWKHLSRWNEEHSRIEMRLASLSDQTVEILGHSVTFKEGEEIHTENCHKYTPIQIEKIALEAGFEVARFWKDETNRFSVAILRPRDTVVLPAVQVEKIQSDLKSSWKFADHVFDMLTCDAYMERPISLRHPYIFYLGHLPAFANNQISNAILNLPSVNSLFDQIFERGIDPDVEDPTICNDHSEVPAAWPEISEIKDFKLKVREKILNNINAVVNGRGIMAQNGRVFDLVAEHELMHAETLLYMYINLDQRFKNKLPDNQTNHIFSAPGYSRGRMMMIPAGWTSVGAEFKKLHFGWDNEFPRIQIFVEQFEISEFPVTNQEFLEFVISGEYDNLSNWESDSWNWKLKIKLKHPNIWRQDENQAWLYKTIFGEVPLTAVFQLPVYVSQAEARAYAKWLGKRLPTEAEFHRAAYGKIKSTKDDDGNIIENSYPWGSADPVPGIHGNFEMFSYAPTAVGAFPKGKSEFGVFDLIGNGWELTSTEFSGLPGFENYIDSYPGYSNDFFDGKHFVQCGASWATHRKLVRKSFRNWYQAHYEYTFSKFHVVSSGISSCMRTSR